MVGHYPPHLVYYSAFLSAFFSQPFPHLFSTSNLLHERNLSSYKISSLNDLTLIKLMYGLQNTLASSANNKNGELLGCLNGRPCIMHGDGLLYIYDGAMEL